MSNLESQELQHGFRLNFQILRDRNAGKQVRAVIKDASGDIIIRGPIVLEENAEASKKAALMEYAVNFMAPVEPKRSSVFDPGGAFEDEEELIRFPPDGWEDGPDAY